MIPRSSDAIRRKWNKYLRYKLYQLRPPPPGSYKTPYQIYADIQLGRLGFKPTEFQEVDLGRAQLEGIYPPVTDIDGSLVALRGPIRLLPLERKNRVRLVMVEFFSILGERSSQPAFLGRALAWQGDHGVHLLEPIEPIVRAPANLNRDEQRLAVLLDNENVPDWYLDCDLPI